jgi:hypothetical protein
MNAESEFTITFFRTYAATEKFEQRGPMPELAEYIKRTTARSKALLPWVKLASFGDVKTPAGSLRHDANVRSISGIEADYDGEEMSFDEVASVLIMEDVTSIVYTSPSHTEAKPRWRVLCPLSLEYPPDQRSKFLGRLNGVFGGVFSVESWTLSQAYYFGRVQNRPEIRVQQTYGRTIDLRDDLDAGAIGRPTGQGRPAGSGGDEAGQDARDDAELISRIITGEGYHVELCALAARYIGRGLRPDTVIEALRGFMLSVHSACRDGRWHSRYAEIPRIVSSAAAKFGDKDNSAWRAIASVTHKQCKARHCSADIKAAVIAKAAEVGLPPDKALALSARILADLTSRRMHHA